MHGSTGLIKNLNRVGLTGWSGAIGSNASSCIKIQSRLEDSYKSIFNEFQKLDLDVYVHLAAITNIGFSEKNKAQTFKLNSEMPIKFLKAADNAGVKRFIFISTSHVYDFAMKPPYKITSKLKPLSVYAKSKLKAEELLTSYKPSSNIKVSVARVFSVLNTSLIGEHYLFSSLVKRALDKNLEPIPGLSKKRDFLTDKEVMNKILNLAKSKEFPPLVNICSGRTKKIKEIAQEVYAKYAKELDFNSIETFDDGSPDLIKGVPSEF